MPSDSELPHFSMLIWIDFGEIWENHPLYFGKYISERIYKINLIVETSIGNIERHCGYLLEIFTGKQCSKMVRWVKGT